MSARDFFEVDLRYVHAEPRNISQKPDAANVSQIISNAREVQDRVHNKGWGAGDFKVAPEDYGKTPEGELAKTYEKMYTPSPEGLKAEWNESQSRFNMVNGNHRVQEAQRQGMSHLPMTVSSVEPHRIDELRAASSERYATFFRDTPPDGRNPTPTPQSPDEPSRAAPTRQER